ncbi:GNAT family N-acetyltransferase [Oceanobacillus bengalensis]|nr:GNAT family N-acetyltransferase [Oceanobacillus bengalensis]
MDIKLEKLQHADANKLYEFELENKAYFEKMVPSRGDDYYHLEIFIKNHEALLDEQAKGRSCFYLIKDENDILLGRMNLVDIYKSQHMGHIGYRVGEAYTGKGVAHTALKLFLSMVSKQGIKQILAKTTTNNIASQRVLEKNGFTCMETDDKAFEMNGQLFKFVYYKWNM